MKKIILTLAFIMGVSICFGKQYADTLSGSFANNDTLKFADLNACFGKKVKITLAIKNTNEVDAEMYIVGKDNSISFDYYVTHWETLVDDNLPFVIDTTDVSYATTGMGYFTNGSNYVYTKTITITDFFQPIPGVYFDLNTTTTGDYKIYFLVEDNL